jgi:hypothetical protein
MTPEQVRELALQLYTVVVEDEGVQELAIWQHCLRTCRRWDVEPPMAMLISEALTGYLYDGGRPQTPPVTPLAKAQAVLDQTPDGEPSAYPANARLTPSAIAAMVGCVLTGGRAQPVSAGIEGRVDSTGTGGL